MKKFKDVSWAVVGAKVWLWDTRTHSVIESVVHKGFDNGKWCTLNLNDGSGFQYNATPDQIFKTRRKAVLHGAEYLKVSRNRYHAAAKRADLRLKSFIDIYRDILNDKA